MTSLAEARYHEIIAAMEVTTNLPSTLEKRSSSGTWSSKKIADLESLPYQYLFSIKIHVECTSSFFLVPKINAPPCWPVTNAVSLARAKSALVESEDRKKKWMEEILYQLRLVGLSHHLEWFIHFSWCSISSINSSCFMKRMTIWKLVNL